MSLLIGLIALPFILAWKLVWNTVYQVVLGVAYFALFAMPAAGAALMHEQGGNWLIGAFIGLLAALVYLRVANLLTGVLSWLLGQGYRPSLREEFEAIDEALYERHVRSPNPVTSGKAPYIYGAKGGGANPIFQENCERHDL